MTNYELLCRLVEMRACDVGHDPMLNSDSATWHVELSECNSASRSKYSTATLALAMLKIVRSVCSIIAA